VHSVFSVRLYMPVMRVVHSDKKWSSNACSVANGRETCVFFYEERCSFWL